MTTTYAVRHRSRRAGEYGAVTSNVAVLDDAKRNVAATPRGGNSGASTKNPRCADSFPERRCQSGCGEDERRRQGPLGTQRPGGPHDHVSGSTNTDSLEPRGLPSGRKSLHPLLDPTPQLVERHHADVPSLVARTTPRQVAQRHRCASTDEHWTASKPRPT